MSALSSIEPGPDRRLLKHQHAACANKASFISQSIKWLSFLRGACDAVSATCRHAAVAHPHRYEVPLQMWPDSQHVECSSFLRRLHETAQQRLQRVAAC
jgi:hypothetical protein